MPEISPSASRPTTPQALVHNTSPPAARNSPDTASSAVNQAQSSQPPVVPAACLGCRGKHLKCDGRNPCSRCQASNSECVYIASRRGHNQGKRTRSRSPESLSLGLGDNCSMPTSTTDPTSFIYRTPNSLFDSTPKQGEQMFRPNGLHAHRPYERTNDCESSAELVVDQQGSALVPSNSKLHAEKSIGSFFHNFHGAHPFTLPREWFFRILGDDANVKPLLAAMRWVGSLFLVDVNVGPQRARFLEEALRLVSDPETRQDGLLVQALILLVVGMDGNCQREDSRQLLVKAERIALDIGLNQRDFAAAHGRGIPVLEECWRRTWWELYVVGGMNAGVHRAATFPLFEVHADVGLPCEEHQFLKGVNIPAPMFLEDLEDREFSGDVQGFSSFAYRIAATRNLGKFMHMPPIYGPDDENLAHIEALLTNWRMHLPSAKKNTLSRDLQADEMMFQANMITYATSILLHQPHSQLDSSPARSVNSCAPHCSVPSGDSPFNAHTRHAVTSATEISGMITQRVPLILHTQFFACVITLSSIVLLSNWALLPIAHDDYELRQQLKLNMGALTKLSTVWRAAGNASGQVKGVAQEIFRAKKALQISAAYWDGYTAEEVMTSITADEAIMHEIEASLQEEPTMPSLVP